jgi:hypothetical protein
MRLYPRRRPTGPPWFSASPDPTNKPVPMVPDTGEWENIFRLIENQSTRVNTRTTNCYHGDMARFESPFHLTLLLIARSVDKDTIRIQWCFRFLDISGDLFLLWEVHLAAFWLKVEEESAWPFYWADSERDKRQRERPGFPTEGLTRKERCKLVAAAHPPDKKYPTKYQSTWHDNLPQVRTFSSCSRTATLIILSLGISLGILIS